MSYSQIQIKLPAKPRNPFPVWVALAFITLWWVIWDLEISFETLAYGVSDMAEYFSRYGQPDFSELSRYLELLGVTLATALWGTAIAFLIGFMIAPFAARNWTAPSILDTRQPHFKAASKASGLIPSRCE